MATKKQKPGAVKAQGQQQPEEQGKILRIGVIQAGKIVEERLVRRREDVTIGASARNTIVVPASTLPKSFALFEVSGGDYSLVFSDTMDGRVSIGDQVYALDQVRSQGKAQPKGKGLLRLPLTDSSRGKVSLGEITLLFQFVTPPPIQPRPQLPPSVRGSLLGQMDWLFAWCFGGHCGRGHGTAALYSHNGLSVGFGSRCDTRGFCGVRSDRSKAKAQSGFKETGKGGRKEDRKEGGEKGEQTVEEAIEVAVEISQQEAGMRCGVSGGKSGSTESPVTGTGCKAWCVEIARC